MKCTIDRCWLSEPTCLWIVYSTSASLCTECISLLMSYMCIHTTERGSISIRPFVCGMFVRPTVCHKNHVEPVYFFRILFAMGRGNRTQLPITWAEFSGQLTRHYLKTSFGTKDRHSYLMYSEILLNSPQYLYIFDFHCCELINNYIAPSYTHIWQVFYSCLINTAHAQCKHWIPWNNLNWIMMLRFMPLVKMIDV